MKVWAVTCVREIDGVSTESLAHIFSTQTKAVDWVQAQTGDGTYVVDDYDVDDAVLQTSPLPKDGNGQ